MGRVSRATKRNVLETLVLIPLEGEATITIPLEGEATISFDVPVGAADIHFFKGSE